MKHSPEYERVDNILHIVANSFHIMVNRETVVSLLNAVDVFMNHLYGTNFFFYSDFSNYELLKSNPLYDARKSRRQSLIEAGKIRPPSKPESEPPPMRYPTAHMSNKHLRTTIFKVRSNSLFE